MIKTKSSIKNFKFVQMTLLVLGVVLFFILLVSLILFAEIVNFCYGSLGLLVFWLLGGVLGYFCFRFMVCVETAEVNLSDRVCKACLTKAGHIWDDEDEIFFQEYGIVCCCKHDYVSVKRPTERSSG